MAQELFLNAFSVGLIRRYLVVNLEFVGVIVRQCRVHAGDGQVLVLADDFFRVMAQIVQDAMRCTLMPVPAIHGLPWRIPVVELNNEPTSILISITLLSIATS